MFLIYFLTNMHWVPTIEEALIRTRNMSGKKQKTHSVLWSLDFCISTITALLNSTPPDSALKLNYNEKQWICSPAPWAVITLPCGSTPQRVVPPWSISIFCTSASCYKNLVHLFFLFTISKCESWLDDLIPSHTSSSGCELLRFIVL